MATYNNPSRDEQYNNMTITNSLKTQQLTSHLIVTMLLKILLIVPHN